MNKLIQNKNKNQPASLSVKKQKPKPEWTTDFVDREQYKLTEVQKIQKKASLQSKNRQEAKRQLQSRLKKLSMGIIDDQTKKIYQTALISKNIDINPPLRRNLTEMIRYEKQQKERNMEENYNYNEQNEEDLDEDSQTINELKEAQNFIKKFEKAKKQQKIQRAVQILSNNPPNNQGFQTKTNNFLRDSDNYPAKNKSPAYDQKKSNKSDILSQDEAISSIEDTIRFMEEKLFNAKRTVDEHSKSFISEANQSFDERQPNYVFEDRQTNFSTKMNFKKPQKNQKKFIDVKVDKKPLQNHDQLEFGTKIGEISHLKIQFKDQNENESDDECLSTIRRMRQLLDNQESSEEKYDLRGLKNKNKDNFASYTVGNLGSNSNFSSKRMQSGNDSEAEVSFSLTLNDEEIQNDLSRLGKNEFIENKFEESEKNEFLLKPSFKKENQNQNLKKLTKQQDDYENEYLNVKQTLFACINSEEPKVLKENKQPNITKFKSSAQNFSIDSDEEGQSSEDSLMVQNKINMWKKQFERQVDPEEEDQEDEPYRHNFLSKETSNKYQEPMKMYKQAQTFEKQKTAEEILINVPNKKPPLAKKNQNDDKFEEMKKMISNASTQIKKLEIQPLKIETLGANQVIGFDFRGSLNIKKNIK